jgi:DNA polymerase III epsilon subunit family exonuclease
MRFIALDLETTGLSPETDTIIEIAAIRFSIEKEGDSFVIKNTEEHSQLIHPERLLKQEITMITGITNDMLVGKPTFESVREKVREFIEDAIIVGHNVLFDIAMLASHGIDLEANKVIDTFELSEIFSQDIESLNLGFLANRYGLIDPTEAEHRALTDTKVSIRLFLRYL